MVTAGSLQCNEQGLHECAMDNCNCYYRVHSRLRCRKVPEYDYDYSWIV